jgi:glycosyltransferase involved in cell wall biosynthesis
MKRSMRVAHVITESQPFGGAQRNTLLTLEGLARRGWEPELFCGAGGELAARARALGIPVTEIADLVRKADPLRDARCLARLLSVFRSRSFAVVHTHSTKAGLLGRLAARAAGVPAVIHTVHGFPFRLDGRLRSRVFVALERLVARAGDATICVGETLRAEVQGWRLPARQKLVTIYSGIDFAAYQRTRTPAETRRELGLGDAGPIIGSIGHLREAKAQRHLLDAIALLRERHPRIVLLLVGEGERRFELEEQIARLGLEGAARLLGERDDIADLLDVFDVFAMSSEWEGVGRALTEAMFWGLPVAVTSVNGVRDLVIDGETGLAVPPADPRALAEAIARLLAEPALGRRLGRAARARVSRMMGAQTMIDSIDDLYRELLGAPATRLHQVQRACAESSEL